MRNRRYSLVGLERTTQTPLLEFDPTTHRWFIWLSYDNDVSAGTYLELCLDGSVNRLTESGDEIVASLRVKGPHNA